MKGDRVELRVDRLKLLSGTGKWKLLCAGALLLLASCQQLGINKIGGSEILPGSLRSNLAGELGAREHPRVVATYGGIYHNAGAERAVANVVGRLVQASEDPSQNYRITILNSPAVNAFALPGGYLYVTRGLLALANDTSELAAVLAHEMAHVTSNHALKRQQRAEAREIGDRVLTDVVQDNDQNRAALASARLSFARFSQVQELQADALGVKTLARAGFDPYAASRFLKAMSDFAAFQSAQHDSSDAPDFLSSHPTTPERVSLAIKSARQFGAPGIGEKDRSQYLRQIDGMLYGDDPLEGYIRGRSFLHKGLGIGFTVPNGYVLENSPEAVLASNGDGTAMRFDGADLTDFPSLRDYMTSGWINGLLTESVRETTVNGLPAVVGAAITQGWSFRIAVVRLGQTGYRFIFANRNPSDNFETSYKSTLDSFRQLTPTEIARLHSLRIHVVSTNAGDTLAKLARGMTGVDPSRRLSFFKVLNGLESDNMLVPGMSVKLIID